MFLEPIRGTRTRGWIEIICGSMFSGKTEELLRRLRRAQIAGLPVQIFKPALDNRYSAAEVVSHTASAMKCTTITASHQLLQLACNTAVVAIDEAQFMDEHLPEVCNALASGGARIILAGLDMDFQGRPFGPMPVLLARAEYITKLQAICMRCGDPASYSYRTDAGNSTVLLGEADRYEARCRECFYGLEATSP